MIPLIGYADRLSARPGDTIDFKVSSTSSDDFNARLVRVICADPNPAGPGMIEEQIPSSALGSYPSRPQTFHPGSYARVNCGASLSALKTLTLTANIFATTPDKGEQSIICCAGRTGEVLVALLLDEHGAVSIRARGAVAGTGVRLTPRHWYQVWASVDVSNGQLSVGHRTLENGQNALISTTGTMAKTPFNIHRILIAAMDGETVHKHFNGKIEAPALYDQVLGADALAEDRHDGIAQWDFSHNIDGTDIIDVSPTGVHGKLINMPARAMTGSNWDGSEMCWRHGSNQYGAIHFHDDDIYDFQWQTDFSFTIPEDLASGVYAMRIECGEHYDAMPFFVCPPQNQTHAALCVLISTFTYVIYGNHARPDFNASWKQRMDEWNAYPNNPAEYPEYGLSTYNYHSDRSGICHACHRRPLFNHRPGYLTFCTGSDSGLRHFQADTHLLYWLEQKGYDYDVITDLELHNEGVQSIAPYKAVITGSHPEYHTSETLDALLNYRDGGGSFLYMGGNGFYWRVALHKDDQGMIEIRRAESGIRAWAAEPGEYYNAFDGSYGGLWRRNGRPPQKLAGVGFSAQGTFLGSYYRRNRQLSEDLAWVFTGVEDDIIGDFGLSGGGAAGFELDRVDVRLGSPETIHILASSENHQSTFVLVPEEQLTHITNWPGKPVKELIRADMVYFETPAGGRVFSTGSITFCGSLPHNNCENNVSRIVGNVLDRFLTA